MPQTDDYGRHEVLHMSNFLHKAIENELVEHDAINANPAWKALAQQASEALYELYQAIGAAHHPEKK